MELPTIIIDVIQNGYMLTFWTKGNQEKLYVSNWFEVIGFIAKNMAAPSPKINI
jgi:hypothetical protein